MPRSSSSSSASLAVLILAAGQGTRMKSRHPKVLHEIGGIPMIRHVMDAVSSLKPNEVRVVIAPDQDAVAAEVAPIPCAIQKKARGTGDAVMAGLAALKGFSGDILVVYGDVPFIQPQTLAAMRKRRAQQKGPGAVFMAFEPDDPAAYGRMLLDEKGYLARIVEFKDASVEERAIRLCNAGPVMGDAEFMRKALKAIAHRASDNREIYLTDLVEEGRKMGLPIECVKGAPEEAMGVNTRGERAVAEAIFQDRLRAHAMANGVTLVDPKTVYLSADARIGRDVVIEPFVVIGPGVVIEDDVHIKAFSHIEGARIASAAVVGPYARLRPGADVGEGAHIGNFVELKNAKIGKGAKANHLSYLGDATVGARANIGAGTITCNYDGFEKFKTEIGDEAFIGSNSALVAPVKIGARAIVGAGSVITDHVSHDALALARSQQTEKSGWAKTFRSRKTKPARKKK